MDYDGRALGRLIAGTRRQRGMTQEVLFGLAGTARTNLAGIEKGRKGHRDANLLTDCGGGEPAPRRIDAHGGGNHGKRRQLAGSGKEKLTLPRNLI